MSLADVELKYPVQSEDDYQRVALSSAYVRIPTKNGITTNIEGNTSNIKIIYLT